MEKICADLMHNMGSNLSQITAHDFIVARFMAEFVGLLATENGMHIDLELKNILLDGDTELSVAMYTSFQAIAASQPIPLAETSFAERFSTAMRSNGWPAELFAATFRYDEPMMMATRASETGRTALHWAAGHYGEWLHQAFISHTVQRFKKGGVFMQRATSYENLVVELIKKGSHLHACWNREFDYLDEIKGKVSPFSSFLRGLSDEYVQYWTADSLSNSVFRWG
jgi:hypothetical protein